MPYIVASDIVSDNVVFKHDGTVGQRVATFKDRATALQYVEFMNGQASEAPYGCWVGQMPDGRWDVYATHDPECITFLGLQSSGTGFRWMQGQARCGSPHGIFDDEAQARAALAKAPKPEVSR